MKVWRSEARWVIARKINSDACGVVGRCRGGVELWERFGK